MESFPGYLLKYYLIYWEEKICKQIEIPYLVTVLMSIPLNILPCWWPEDYNVVCGIGLGNENNMKFSTSQQWDDFTAFLTGYLIVKWIYFDEFCILIIQLISKSKKADFQLSNCSFLVRLFPVEILSIFFVPSLLTF